MLHLDVFTGEADSWNVTVFSVTNTIALLGRTPAAYGESANEGKSFT